MLSKQRRKRRLGILVAFYVLDKTGSGQLEPEDYIPFLQVIYYYL